MTARLASINTRKHWTQNKTDSNVGRHTDCQYNKLKQRDMDLNSALYIYFETDILPNTYGTARSAYELLYQTYNEHKSQTVRKRTF